MTTITIKSDGLTGNGNPTCQHHFVDNDTGKCKDCREQMASRTEEPDTIVDAPNAAACTNPECLAALDAGEYDDGPLPGCTNPSGLYIADRSRERTVTVGVNVTYECKRCRNNGTTITYNSEGIVWSCGGVHRGDYIIVKPE